MRDVSLNLYIVTLVILGIPPLRRIGWVKRDATTFGEMEKSNCVKMTLIP